MKRNRFKLSKHALNVTAALSATLAICGTLSPSQAAREPGTPHGKKKTNEKALKFAKDLTKDSKDQKNEAPKIDERKSKPVELSEAYRVQVLNAHQVGKRLSMPEIRKNLLELTGEVSLSGNLGLFSGKKLSDRHSLLNRYVTRRFLIERLQSYGYEVSVEAKVRGGERGEIKHDLEVDFEEDSKAWKREVEKKDPAFNEDLEYGTHLVRKFSEKDLPLLRASIVNIYVEIPGTGQEKGKTEIAAHYDTEDTNVPGADDNGTGVTTALEMARSLKSLKPEKTIRVLFDDLEEHGRLGSELHLEIAKQQNDEIEQAIVIDVIGYAPKIPDEENKAPFVIEIGNADDHKKKGSFEKTVALGNLFADQTSRILSRKVSPSVAIEKADGEMADHGRYWDRKIPAILVAAPYEGDMVNPHHHKETDKVSEIDFTYFESVARATLEGLARLSGLTDSENQIAYEDIPLSRERPEGHDYAAATVIADRAARAAKETEKAAKEAERAAKVAEWKAFSSSGGPLGDLAYSTSIVPSGMQKGFEKEVPVYGAGSDYWNEFGYSVEGVFFSKTIEVLWNNEKEVLKVRWGDIEFLSSASESTIRRARLSFGLSKHKRSLIYKINSKFRGWSAEATLLKNEGVNKIFKKIQAAKGRALPPQLVVELLNSAGFELGIKEPPKDLKGIFDLLSDPKAGTRLPIAIFDYSIPPRKAERSF